MTTPIDAATFRRTLGAFATGVTIATVRDAAGVDHGMTVSAFSSLSLSPPLVLVCIDHAATFAPQVAEAHHIGVSVLGDTQQALSQQFAQSGAVRFDGVDVVRGVTGVPLVVGAIAQLEGRITARHDAGDHTIIIAEIVAAASTHGAPLLYYRGQYRRLAAE